MLGLHSRMQEVKENHISTPWSTLATLGRASAILIRTREARYSARYDPIEDLDAGQANVDEK